MLQKSAWMGSWSAGKVLTARAQTQPGLPILMMTLSVWRATAAQTRFPRLICWCPRAVLAPLVASPWTSGEPQRLRHSRTHRHSLRRQVAGPALWVAPVAPSSPLDASYSRCLIQSQSPRRLCLAAAIKAMARAQAALRRHLVLTQLPLLLQLEKLPVFQKAALHHPLPLPCPRPPLRPLPPHLGDLCRYSAVVAERLCPVPALHLSLAPPERLQSLIRCALHACRRVCLPQPRLLEQLLQRHLQAQLLLLLQETGVAAAALVAYATASVPAGEQRSACRFPAEPPAAASVGMQAAQCRRGWQVLEGRPQQAPRWAGA